LVIKFQHKTKQLGYFFFFNSRMRICAIGRLNLRKTSRRDDIDEGLQLVFGNGCGSKTRYASLLNNYLSTLMSLYSLKTEFILLIVQ